MGDEGSDHPPAHHELARANSADDDHHHKRPPLQQRNSWPTNHLSHGDKPSLSPRGPVKSHLAKLREDDVNKDEERTSGDYDPLHDDAVPDPERQRHIIGAIDSECTCTYAVSKAWYRRWEEYVGTNKAGTAGEGEPPSHVDMDAHNDTNNEYVHEDIWKLLIHWYGLSHGHQLDRKHLYFKDEKMFDVCVLSPFSGIVEHQVKKFNRFEEIGYIECQLRRIFNVVSHKQSRMWISEKAQVPRFRQLLLRFRMLNDCIHRDKVYILALEVCQGDNHWPTEEPGEPKGDLSKYHKLVSGKIIRSHWELELCDTISELQVAVQSNIKQTSETFLHNTLSLLREREREMDSVKATLEDQLEKVSDQQKHVDSRLQEVTEREDTAEKNLQSVKAMEQDVTSQQEAFQQKMTDMENLHRIQQSKIKLDIGGQMFTTSLRTLQRDEDSRLGTMFSGRFELKQESDGSYFIDRDGTYFRYILNYLRDGCIEAGTLPNDPFMMKELLREAKHYQLTSLVQDLEERLTNHPK